jgi:Raf kinase inhibitor-like YbhB/YbcL family protein
MGLRQKIASYAGKAISGIRAGDEELAIRDPGLRTTRALDIESSAFESGAEIPQAYSADGEGVSPPLRWSGVPDGTRELVLLCEDPDAPKRTPYVHWALYGMPPDLRELGAGCAPVGAYEGRNSRLVEGWTPPSPPAGHGTHHYHFELFALDRPLSLGAHADRDEIVEAMRGHVLAEGDLVGTYERN